MAELCGKMDAGLLQLLPVNDTGYESSPYSALTVFALHPLYLKIGDLDELKPEASTGNPQAAQFQEKLRDLRDEFEGNARFPFQKLLRAKLELLREIYAAYQSAIRRRAENGSLGDWIAQNPWVKEYAVYRRLKEANGEKSWRDWPEYREAGTGVIEALWNDGGLRDKHLFWAWIQEALDGQFSKAAEKLAEKGIILEGDLPILINEDSCDVWAHPELFNQQLSAGAPPDMYSPDGQNWGFPTYNWEALAKTGYDWWRRRLKAAEKYYQAYRIDHVLGFFRIWAAAKGDYSSALGRFIPYVPLKQKDLAALGFDAARLRWLARPHIPTGELWNALRSQWGGPYQEGDIAAAADHALRSALNRIGEEELWLFKDGIAGEKDIAALRLHPAAERYLIQAWHNRLLVEYEPGSYTPAWYYRDSRAYVSLSPKEREELEALLEKRRRESEGIWEKEGKKLLAMLAGSSSMLPCAEDLGAVPDCVPKTLKQLKILGLRVVRWSRLWDEAGQPYIPFEDYPELSVCTPAVHDSSTLREWWEREADQEYFSGFAGFPSLPRRYNPGVARVLLQKTAAAASRFRVFQIQDLLHLSLKWYAEDPASERINVPGTVTEFNWTYRLPAAIGELGQDDDFVQGVRELAKISPQKKRKAKKPASGTVQKTD
jgi:4-alpha-glucanotransferase